MNDPSSNMKDMTVRRCLKDERKKEFKRELLEIFKRYGYMTDEKDYEVTFRTTSGSIAWITINRIETIK
jgi:hypothetical protein